MATNKKKTEEPVKTPLVTVENETMTKLLAEVEELKRKDEENQKKLKMLYEVADKGRVFNYENSNAEKKPMKVKLSEYGGGLIIGWKTLKDELVKHPTTGLVVGENQEYELLILNADGQTTRVIISGYPAFSNSRYSSRIEAEVIGKSEDYNGNITYNLLLSDGRQISLAGQFIN